MNPFQRAEQASREAAERRRRGNAARAYNRQSYKNKYAKPKAKPKPKTPPRYSYARPGSAKPKSSAYGRAGPTPRYSARPGPTPRTSRAGPTPRTGSQYARSRARKTHTPIFEENNQGYTYNFEPETPPRRKPKTPPLTEFQREYRNALKYFGYGSLAGKKASNVTTNYRKMALKKHPNKGHPRENFEALKHYYNILKAELDTRPF
jgi:hypothetical protein